MDEGRPKAALSMGHSTPTLGIGFDINRFYDTTHPAEVALSNGDTFTLAAGLQFAGFISSTPISQVDIRILSGSGQGIYNRTSGSAAMLPGGLALLAKIRHRNSVRAPRKPGAPFPRRQIL